MATGIIVEVIVIEPATIDPKKQINMLDFPQMGDERGHLVIVESGREIPFEIKRVFYIYGSGRDVVRGQHANR